MKYGLQTQNILPKFDTKWKPKGVARSGAKNKDCSLFDHLLPKEFRGSTQENWNTENSLKLMPPLRVELRTYWLRVSCSTNWATGAYWVFDAKNWLFKMPVAGWQQPRQWIAMSSSRAKPKHTYPDFPLITHTTMCQWRKKNNGKSSLFCVWSCSDQPPWNYCDTQDDLQAGRQPSQHTNSQFVTSSISFQVIAGASRAGWKNSQCFSDDNNRWRTYCWRLGEVISWLDQRAMTMIFNPVNPPLPSMS